MPNDLYDQDALAWSQQQADLLRRHALGEDVNGIDWAHVVEEIDDTGLCELPAVEPLCDRARRSASRLHDDRQARRPLPDKCPVALDQLLTAEPEALEAAFMSTPLT